MPDITYQHITGQWAHLIDDRITDTDAEPDKVFPTGKVRFTPNLGSQGALPAGSPTESVSVADVTALVTSGLLTDLEGRPGIWLAATIGGYAVYWTATPELKWNNTKLPSTPITFGPPDADVTEVHLNDLINVTPPDGADIGRQTPRGDLHLPTVGDYEYTYTLGGGDFDTDSELYYLIGNPPASLTRWDFALEDNIATVTKPNAAVALVAAGTKYWLMFKADATSPARELLTGVVRK